MADEQEFFALPLLMLLVGLLVATAIVLVVLRRHRRRRQRELRGFDVGRGLPQGDRQR
jgi:hypothetical protein